MSEYSVVRLSFVLGSEPDLTFIAELHPITTSGVRGDQYEHAIRGQRKDDDHDRRRHGPRSVLSRFSRLVDALAISRVAANA